MSAAIPQDMRAAVYRGPRQISVERLPVPDPGPDDVLVEVSHCGICGTDLHLVVEGLGQPNSVGGHEYSGTVRSVGEGVDAWTVGDRVAVDPNQPTCGRCEYCRAGRGVLCTERGRAAVDPYQGAFAQYVRVNASQLLRVPKALPLRDAALMEPLAVALHGVTLSGIQTGGRALVTGAGPIGALSLLALKANGVEHVSVVEPGPARREHARRLGASAVFTPEDLPSPASFYDVVDDAFDAVLECSGRAKAVQQGLAQLKRGGTLVLVGAGTETPVMDTTRMILNELTVRGSYNYDPDGLREALDLLEQGRIRAAEVIEPDDIPLTGLLGALEGLAEGKIAGKVLVAPGGEDR